MKDRSPSLTFTLLGKTGFSFEAEIEAPITDIDDELHAACVLEGLEVDTDVTLKDLFQVTLTSVYDLEPYTVEALQKFSYSDLADLLNNVDALGEPFAIWAEDRYHDGGSRSAFDEEYRGHYDSMADYAEQSTSETTDIPNHIKTYIDWERMGNDLRHDVTAYDAPSGGVYIFDA